LFIGIIFFFIYLSINKDYTSVGFQISYLVSLFVGFNLYSENNNAETEEEGSNLNT
jgi:hypothetical protein